MNFYIVHIGEPKEDYFKKAFAEYEKRLGGENPVTDIPIKPYKTSGARTDDSEIKLCLEKEGKALINELCSQKIAKTYKIALCIEGKEMSSEDLASKIAECKTGGKCGITFVIGGSWGMTEEVKKMCDLRLSFSKMTFPHSLFRVMLIEQIYRAISINENKKYHK